MCMLSAFLGLSTNAGKIEGLHELGGRRFQLQDLHPSLENPGAE